MDKEKFLNDALTGLQSCPKRLPSKYFYDTRGDELFEHIMHSKEYYLTRRELEIFKIQRTEIADAVTNQDEKLDIIALGPGDFSKTIYLVEELYKRNVIEKCFPIDISENIINNLKPLFQKKFPAIDFHGLTGEYFEKLPEVIAISKNRKLVFFVGATIGNFLPDQMIAFGKQLKKNLNKGDRVLIGFDLKKDPRKILAAYNDTEGWTAKFNLNLLERMNRELGADFHCDKFEHYPVYDPISGACKSFLVSSIDQMITIGNQKIEFKKGEIIHTEVSQKYDLEQIIEAAVLSKFRQVATFIDSKKYFVDVLWEVM